MSVAKSTLLCCLSLSLSCLLTSASSSVVNLNALKGSMKPIAKNDLMYNQTMMLKDDITKELGLSLYEDDTFEAVAYSMKQEIDQTAYMVAYDLGNGYNITALVNVPLLKTPQI